MNETIISRIYRSSTFSARRCALPTNSCGLAQRKTSLQPQALAAGHAEDLRTGGTRVQPPIRFSQNGCFFTSQSFLLVFSYILKFPATRPHIRSFSFQIQRSRVRLLPCLGGKTTLLPTPRTTTFTSYSCVMHAPPK